MKIKKTKIILLVLSCFFLVGTREAKAEKTNQISQWGITWYFDKEYEYGTFANGDFWVLGPVTITRITPDFDGARNGWEVNPTAGSTQGFDINVPNYDSSLVPNLPYEALAGESVVKQYANEIPTSNSCTRSFSILTVVDEVPPEMGGAVFRPPYSGTNKGYLLR